MDAHIKNVEASTADGKFDPAAGLVQVTKIITNPTQPVPVLCTERRLVNFL